MPRLGGQFELAVALDVAGNAFLLDHRDNALHGTFVRLVILAGLIGPQGCAQRRVVLSHASVALPAVAARRFA
ncbi:hypothetical protein A259_05181, partial [Pseudomonas syringae pv. actinidiae ICMP 19070]